MPDRPDMFGLTRGDDQGGGSIFVAMATTFALVAESNRLYRLVCLSVSLPVFPFLLYMLLLFIMANKDVYDSCVVELPDVVGDEVGYDQLDNEVDGEDLSESDITSSDDDDVEDSRAAAAALDDDGTHLAADDDFASAIARAAQLAGLTVVGTTVTDSNKGLLSPCPDSATGRVA